MGAHYLVDIHANPLNTAGFLDVRYPPNGQSPCNGAFIINIPDGFDVQTPTNVQDLVSKKASAIAGFFAGTFFNIVFDDMLDTSSLDLTPTAARGAFGLRNQVSLFNGGEVRSKVIPLVGVTRRSGTGGAATGNDVFTVIGQDFTASPVVQVGDVLFFNSNYYEIIAVSPTGGLSNTQVQVASNIPTGTGDWVISEAATAPVQAAVTWEVYEMLDTDPANGRFGRTYSELPPGSITVQASFNGGSTWINVVDRSVLNILPTDQGTDFIIRFTNGLGRRVRLGSWAVLY